MPAAVLACPVCGTAQREQVRLAFVESTVFLSAVPLLMIGAFTAYFVWKARRLRRGQE